MTIPFLCVAAVFVLLYATKTPIAIAAVQQRTRYDNRHPRDQQAELVGWGRRAVASHQNGFEGFAPFAAAVVIAHLGHADPLWSSVVAVTYVVARLLYSILYLANFATARSLAWFVGFLCTAVLFALPFFA